MQNIIQYNRENKKEIKCEGCGQIKKKEKLKKLAEYVNFYGDIMITYICECNHIITLYKSKDD